MPRKTVVTRRVKIKPKVRVRERWTVQTPNGTRTFYSRSSYLAYLRRLASGRC